MNNLGIQKRVLIIALLPAIIIATTLGIYFVNSQIRDMRSSLEERGRSIVRQLAPAAEFGVFSGNREMLVNLASSVLSEVDVRSVQIRSVTGTINIIVGQQPTEFARVIRPQGDYSPHVLPSLNKASLFFEAPIVQSVIAVEDYSETTGEASLPPVQRVLLGSVMVELSLENTINNQHNSVLRGGIYTLLGLLLTGMLAMRIGRAVTDPILEITRGVQELEQGRLDTRIRTSARGEIEFLQKGINSMAASLQGAQENLQDQIHLATSELRKTLAELEAKNEELEVERERAQEANVSKSQFLANMSHELRTPLNAIIGYSEMLEEEAQEAGDTTFTADIIKINTAGKHLLALINDILDLSKIEAGKMSMFLETTDILAISQYTVATIRPLAEKNKNTLVLDCPGDIGEMYSDVTKIRQVLFNLLSNACKFTREGEVHLKVRRVSEQGRDWIRFDVSDTGIGMSQEQMKHLFEAFSQADASISRNYGGTGLGLAICKRFSEIMGGRLNARSEAGKGSVFSLALPAEASLQAVAGPLMRDISKVVGTYDEVARRARLINEDERIDAERRVEPSTILVIDDDVSMHDLLNRLLVKEGFYVEIAPNGEDGLRKARELEPDVIVLDVLMPGMDGWSVLSRLKNDKDTADIPVVMLTMVDDRSKGYALGVTDYIYKPVDRDRLMTTLKRCVRYGDTSPILIVDDDAGQRDLLKRTLEKEGWEIMRAHNGRAALEAVHSRLPSVIILDLMMPEMDGFEFVSHLREDPRTRDVPVIVLTAMDLSQADEDRLLLGVTEILKKGASSKERVVGLVKDLVQSASKKQRH